MKPISQNADSSPIFAIVQEEMIDTSTATGNLVFQLFAVLAEFERNLIRERSAAGMKAARARGVTEGRPG